MARRAGGIAGVVGIALILAALFLPGPAPKTSDSIGHLSSVLVDRRSAFLAGTFLAGLGEFALLWFLGALRDALGEDAAGLATTAVAGGLVGSIFMVTGIAIVSGFALVAAPLAQPALVRAVTDIGNVLVGMGKFGLAAMVLASALAARRRQHIGNRGLQLAVVAVVVAVASALPPLLANTGVWQFGGPVDLAGGVALGVWLAWFSLTVVTRQPV
jgi:hypothetical protein